MLVWLVTIGEPWPSDGENPRMHRTGTMARVYARGGDQVVWFNNIFDHYAKRSRFSESTTIQPEPNLTIVGLMGRPYTKNISAQRIRHHADVAADWKRIVKDMPRPDVIIASMPPLELSREAVRYGQAHGVPVVVDIRDLWPDIFLEVFPKSMQWAGKILVSPFYRMLKESVRKASAISGVSEHAVDWALNHAAKPKARFDGALPLAYSPEEIPGEVRAEAGRFWDKAGIREGDETLTVCLFGSLTHRIEVDTVLQAARLLQKEPHNKVRFVVCGVGTRAADVIQCASETASLISQGWINAAQISVLMERSQIGLLPYPSSDDFVRIIPNKVFDYFSGGLPILTSLQGATGDLIASSGAGWMYRNGDPADLARLLSDLSRNPDRVQTAAASSIATAKDYSAAKIYGEFRDRLCGLIDAGRPNSA